jgi:hypothetical protein
VSRNKVPHEGDDQGSMLRGILYKESSGRNAISFEVYRYRCIQITGGRVRFLNEKLGSIALYNEAVRTRAELGRNQPFPVRHRRKLKDALRSTSCRIPRWSLLFGTDFGFAVQD